MAANMTTQIPEALEEWATDVFFMRMRNRRRRNIFRRLLRIDDSNRGFEEAWEVSGLGPFATKEEGAPIAFSNPVQGNRTRIAHSTYALGYRVTMEMREDDRWDIVRRMPNDLADSAMDHQERLAHDPINDAFDGTNFTGLDGLSLINTAHTSLRPEAGTRSNELSPGQDLTEASLEAMVNIGKTLTDNQGRFILVEPKRLVIHPNNEFNAQRILGSEFRPGTADNDIGVMQSSRSGIEPISSPYLDSTDDWFLVDPELNDVRWFDRKDVNQQTSQDDETLDMKHTAHYRAGVGFWRWEGWFGSNVP